MAEGPVQASLNEAAIKRLDPYVSKILDVAKYVALYSFEENSWKKTEVEGSLFVYSRSGEPYYNIVVLNRLNKDNLVESITSQVDIEQQVPFLLYKNSKGSILGIWFFDKSECIRLSSLIEKLMAKSSHTMKQQMKPSKGGDGVDIFKMLSKAQETYSNSIDGKPATQKKQSPCEIDGTPKIVADFFAKAGGAPQSGNIPVSFGRTKTVSELEAGSSPLGGVMSNMSKLAIAKPQKASEIEKNSLFQDFTISNTVHSVEHIEKQQRAITPISSETASIKRNSRGQPPGFGFARALPSDEVSSSSVLTVKKENGLNGVSLPSLSSPPGFLPANEEKKPDLMPPAMFTPRGAFSWQPPPEPLTRNQLFQAFDYLLRNDPEFMTKLHEAYVKSLTDKII